MDKNKKTWRLKMRLKTINLASWAIYYYSQWGSLTSRFLKQKAILKALDVQQTDLSCKIFTNKQPSGLWKSIAKLFPFRITSPAQVLLQSLSGQCHCIIYELFPQSNGCILRMVFLTLCHLAQTKSMNFPNMCVKKLVHLRTSKKYLLFGVNSWHLNP